MKYLRIVSRHVATALRLESLTPAGRINFSLVAIALVIVVSTGMLDLAQTIIRAWKAHYETGLPSALDFFICWLIAMILCVMIVAAAQRPRSDQDE
jgi:hypothetical protein